MAAPEPQVEVEAFDEEEFRQSFRRFHQSFTAASEAGIPIGDLLVILEDEGVQLPDWIRQAL